MRTLPFLRWIDGARTGILSLTAAVPAPGTSVSDTNVMTPAPSRHPASGTPLVPAHPPVEGVPAPVPYGLTPLNIPRGAARSGTTGLRRSTATWRPVVPRTAPAHGERRGRLRLRAARGVVPLPGAGGFLAPAGTAVQGVRGPFPSPGRESAAPLAAIRPMSLLPKANYVPGGAGAEGGESLLTGAGRAPVTAVRDAGPRHTPHIPHTPHAPAARPAPAARDTAPDPRAPRRPVPGRTD